MTFRIQGLDRDQFAHLIDQPDEVLAAHGVSRHVVSDSPGFPDRIEVRDLAIGETALLLNYEHHAVDTPYRSRHAIFIGERSRHALDLVDRLPEAILIRPISLRAFDTTGNMVDADLVGGDMLHAVIARFLARPEIDYLHAHYAKRGCYAARIVRG